MTSPSYEPYPGPSPLSGPSSWQQPSFPAPPPEQSPPASISTPTPASPASPPISSEPLVLPKYRRRSPRAARIVRRRRPDPPLSAGFYGTVAGIAGFFTLGFTMAGAAAQSTPLFGIAAVTAMGTVSAAWKAIGRLVRGLRARSGTPEDNG